MKKIFLTLLITLFTAVSAFADDKQEALNFFNSYVNAANSYSTSIPDFYLPSAKIIRQVIKPDGTIAEGYTDTATYFKQMRISQVAAKARKYRNEYTNITAEPVDGGYKVSSLRRPNNEAYKLKTYMIVKKQPNGKWLITEEMMQTKEQILLKYMK